MRRRVGAAVLAVILTAAPATGCGASPTPLANGAPGPRIDLRTPPGLRAKQTMDMLNSDWPIGPVSVGTLAEPDKVDEVVATMDSLWWDRPFQLDGVDIRAGAATLHLSTSYGARQDVKIRTGDDGMVSRLRAATKPPPIHSWRDVDTVLSRTGARYSYQASRIHDGRCEKVAGTNTRESLPLASIFKLYVLLAVAEQIKAGRLAWEDRLTVTRRAKVVGSSGLEELPDGAEVSVRTAAEKMIATSDNMATDLLIGKIGARAVERALVTAGHHDPASMTPFPTMYQLFSVGWGKPDLRERWQRGSRQDRAELLRQADARPYEPDPTRAHVPASQYGAEWYGSAEDICRVHVALQTAAVGAAAPVKQIMAAVRGIDLNHTDWPYVGAKAGGLPGDLTFSWYAVDRAGQPWVVSFQLNWRRDHGRSVTGWVLQLANQVFGLLPTRP
ncbi:MAG TPA: serine hydrolase [Mycobacterium sp.]